MRKNWNDAKITRERERERGYSNIARKSGSRERVKLSLGSNQGPLMVMRDGVQRKGLIYPWVVLYGFLRHLRQDVMGELVVR